MERTKDDQIADLNKAYDKLMDVIIKQSEVIVKLATSHMHEENIEPLNLMTGPAGMIIKTSDGKIYHNHGTS